MMTKPTYQSNRDKMIQSRSANRLKSREEVGLGKNVKLSDNDKKDTSKDKGEKVKVTSFKDTSMGKGEKVKVTPFKDTSMGKNTDSAIKQQVDKYVEKRKVPINKDLTIDKSAEGKAKYKILKKEIEPEVKKPEVKKEVKNYINIFSDYPYIFNLGHGVLPQTKVETVKLITEIVQGKRK